jgi:hypothetical protein
MSLSYTTLSIGFEALYAHSPCEAVQLRSSRFPCSRQDIQHRNFSLLLSHSFIRSVNRPIPCARSRARFVPAPTTDEPPAG